MNLKRIFRLGTGCGIEINGDTLRVVAAKSRPSGVSVVGQTRLENFRERPAREWGAEYASFLKDHGLTHLSATVALPRDEVIVRQLLLPPIAGKELANAVRYQLDSLHPFVEDEVYHAFAPLRAPGEGKGQLPVAVAIAEKSRVDSYADLFEAAGIAVAAFTVTDAALVAAMRVRWDEPPRPFVFTCFRNGSIDVYGEAEDRPLWTAQFDLATINPAKALQLAAAELRLDPETPASLVVCGDHASRSAADGEPEAEPSPAERLAADVPPAFQLRTITELLPAPVAAPAAFDLRQDVAPYAVALESACPRMGWRANLLPVERRKSDSRWLYAPTIVLVVLLAGLGIAFAVRPLMQDSRYLAALGSESQRLEQIVRNVEQTEQESGHVRRRLARLQELRQRSAVDLRILRELSQTIPDDVWLQNLEINDGGAQMTGEGPAAAPLLAVLDGSSSVMNAAFTSSLVKTENGERFQIGVKRRPVEEAVKQAAGGAPVTPQAAPARPAPASAAPSAEKEESTLSTVSGEEAAAAEESK